MLALRREHLLDLEREQSELDAEWEEWVLVRDAADSHLAQLRVLCAEAIDDLFARRQAALEARWAVEEAEAEKAAAAREKAQAAAREAEQAERAKLDREREQAWADLQAREAQAKALRAQLAALHCEPLQEQVRWEMPAETRDRLHAGAELVWGSVQGSQAAAAPKVFKLTGMSASEVRELTSQVSQETTGTEECVALTRSGLS